MANSTYFGGGDMRDPSNGPGFDVGIVDQNTVELDFQDHIGQQLLSPIIHDRNDSMFSCSTLDTPRHSISHHQAEVQPYASMHQNLYSPNGYSQLPANSVMSRSASQYSSSSSGQRPHLHSQQRASRGSFGDTLVWAGSAMSRSISDTSASQRTAPQNLPLQSPSHFGHFHAWRSSDVSPCMGYEQVPAAATRPYNYAINNAAGEGVPRFENEDRSLGQTGHGNESLNLLRTFTCSSRAPQGSFGEHTLCQNQTPIASPQHIAGSNFPSPGSRSQTQSPLVGLPHSNRRRRQTPSSPSTRIDPVIGQVTLAGKFKCLKETCHDNSEDMTFNRHADFKRHYENLHAGRCIEYFCPEPGCARSRNPDGGKKGRGFKGRKDKRNEHHKAVHRQESKKRKTIHEGDEYFAEQEYYDSTGARHVKVGRRSDTS